MNIKKILPKFEALKQSILTDGEIDVDEVNEMIEFIKPYCRNADTKFLQLMRILIMAKEDGKITELETRAIVEALDDVSRFLRYERIIEIVLVSILYNREHMDKEHILAYWNLSRVIRTIPENAFEKDPNAAKLLEDYIYLEKEYISFLNYVNTKKEENKQ